MISEVFTDEALALKRFLVVEVKAKPVEEEEEKEVVTTRTFDIHIYRDGTASMEDVRICLDNVTADTYVQRLVDAAMLSIKDGAKLEVYKIFASNKPTLHLCGDSMLDGRLDATGSHLRLCVRQKRPPQQQQTWQQQFVYGDGNIVAGSGNVVSVRCGGDMKNSPVTLYSGGALAAGAPLSNGELSDISQQVHGDLFTRVIMTMDAMLGDHTATDKRTAMPASYVWHDVVRPSPHPSMANRMHFWRAMQVRRDWSRIVVREALSGAYAEYQLK